MRAPKSTLKFSNVMFVLGFYCSEIFTNAINNIETQIGTDFAYVDW